jgi:hypothetical protein
MILTVLPVPPPPVRPSISVDGGAMRGEDDLTYKLAEIIRANSSLRKFEEEGAPAHVVNEFETLLQVRVFFFSFKAFAVDAKVLSIFHSGTSLLTWTTISLDNLKPYRNRADL